MNPSTVAVVAACYPLACFALAFAILRWRGAA